jgi:membrane protein involved in colicin uptake
MSTTHTDAHEAVAAAREAREEAERALQLSRRRRADAARTLEYDVYPMRIDEAERARRRQLVADADADVAVHGDAVRRARAIEDAVMALVAAVSGTNVAEKAVASTVVDLLGGSTVGASVSRSRVEPASVRRVPRAARRPGNRPLPA